MCCRVIRNTMLILISPFRPGSTTGRLSVEVTRTPGQPIDAQKKHQSTPDLVLWYASTSSLCLEATIKPFARYPSRLSFFYQPGNPSGSYSFSILLSRCASQSVVVSLPPNFETVVCIHWKCMISYFSGTSKEGRSHLG